ncbi:MAG TPA: twin-arginine translocase subunit TatC [Candidatus Dormibacteraeota bacterium]
MALLDRGLRRRPQGAPPPSEPAAERRMTVVEHLEDLRRALLVSLSAWGIASILTGIFVTRPVIHFLIVRGGVDHAYFTRPTGAFLLAVQVAIELGFVVAFPVISQQVWWFVSPGLHKHERRLVLPLFVSTVIFFAVGVAFALLSLPLFIRLLTGFAPVDLTYLPLIDDYIGFVLLLVIGYGLVFELPVAIYVLGRFGIISSRWLYQHRLAWIIGLAVAANFLTPGADPISPLLMFIPLYVFWEASTLLLKLRGR